MKNSRGCNYSTEKDVCIARAYVHVMTDSIASSEQKQLRYYGQIYQYYKNVKSADAPLQSESSIKTRLKDMQKLCVRFSACFVGINAMKRSGVNEGGENFLAIALFNKKKEEHPKKDVSQLFKNFWIVANHARDAKLLRS